MLSLAGYLKDNLPEKSLFKGFVENTQKELEKSKPFLPKTDKPPQDLK